MKLVIAIVNQDDATRVSNALNSGGYSSTRFASQGSYLFTDNTTFLVGVDEERVEEVKRIIAASVHRREHPLPPLPTEHYGYPVDDDQRVTVGGATIFVVDTEQFERI